MSPNERRGVNDASLPEAGTAFCSTSSIAAACVQDFIAETIVVYEGKDALRAAAPAPFER